MERDDRSEQAGLTRRTFLLTTLNTMPTSLKPSNMERLVAVPCLSAGLYSMTQPTDRHNVPISDVLLHHGLWPTRRELREELAKSLDDALFTAGEVDAVCTSILSMSNDKRIALGEVVNCLRDHARLKAAIEDLAKVGTPGRKWHPGEMDRSRSMQSLDDERKAWADADRDHYIRCRRADGIPEEVAAAEWAASRRHK